MNFYLKFGKQILTGILALCYLSIIVTLFLWEGSAFLLLSVLTFGVPLIIAGAILSIPLRGVKLCYSKTKDELSMKYMFSNSVVFLFLLFTLSRLPLSKYTEPNSELISPLLTASIIGSMVAYLFFSATAFFITKYSLKK